MQFQQIFTHSSLFKVAKRLKSAEEEKPAEEPVVATSSGGEVMTKERMDAIRNKKSIHQNLVESYEDEQCDRMFDHLEKKEAMEEKMVNTKQLVCADFLPPLYIGHGLIWLGTAFC